MLTRTTPITENGSGLIPVDASGVEVPASETPGSTAPLEPELPVVPEVVAPPPVFPTAPLEFATLVAEVPAVPLLAVADVAVVPAVPAPLLPDAGVVVAPAPPLGVVV